LIITTKPYELDEIKQILKIRFRIIFKLKENYKIYLDVKKKMSKYLKMHLMF
jgi:DNA helicase TIP49 (TBP-interacting protein)